MIFLTSIDRIFVPKDQADELLRRLGSNAAVPEACAAVSGANTPSILPLPNPSGSLEKRLARL